MPCFLPVRPRLSPDPRVFGPSSRRAIQVNAPPGCSSPALQRHLSVSPLRSPLPCRRPRETRDRPRKAPRRSFVTLQRIRVSRPFFSRLRLKSCPVGLARPTGSPALRVWLPSRRRQLATPLEASFSPQRSWASPFRAFLLPHGRSRVSPRSAALALSRETLTTSHRRSSGFLPPGKPYPFSRPKRLARVGALALLGFRPLGFSLRETNRKASPFPVPLAPFDLPKPCDSENQGPQGLFSPRPSVSLRRGRQPVWSFPPAASATP
jgi:hypothetical protein